MLTQSSPTRRIPGTLTALTLTALTLTALTGLALVAQPVQAQSTVVPNGNSGTPGGSDNRFPFFVSGGMRYQQDYSADQFTILTGPEYITSIAFRPSPYVSQAFTTNLSDIQIDLSTTSAGPDSLSSTFASNVGADDTVVYGAGPLTLTSSDTQGDFDTVITFTTPFLYDPSAGNLLLDIRNDSTDELNSYFDAADVLGDSVGRVYGPGGSPGASTGAADTLGLVTKFTFSPAAVTTTPEPASYAAFAMGGFGLLGLGLKARKSRICA